MSSKVAMVTGASKGLGRGIARALGSHGMRVWLTGRDVEALTAAAAEVTAAGGIGIAVQCDHSDDAQVSKLFARLEVEEGRLDLLVNNAAAVHPRELVAPGPFWEKDIKLAQMIDVGLRSHYVAAHAAAPLMIRSGAESSENGLIACISFYGAASYFHGPAYGAAKAGTDKMVFDMAVDFAQTPVSVVSIWPGYILTDQLRDLPDEFRSPELTAMLPGFETPEFTGDVIAALLNDPALKSMSGKALIGARLGAKYGIADRDGKHPHDLCALHGEPLSFFSAEARP